MSKRENNYIENLYRKFEKILDYFVDSEVVERSNKVPILNEFKGLIDMKIRQVQNEDYLM